MTYAIWFFLGMLFAWFCLGTLLILRGDKE
jgi:hypothetical protein